MTGPLGPKKGSLPSYPARMWDGLLAEARREPEVRRDRVEEARRRLTRGDYLTPEAAVGTAAILAGAPLLPENRNDSPK
jgi:hypothetical protein